MALGSGWMLPTTPASGSCDCAFLLPAISFFVKNCFHNGWRTMKTDIKFWLNVVDWWIELNRAEKVQSFLTI